MSAELMDPERVHIRMENGFAALRRLISDQCTATADKESALTRLAEAEMWASRARTKYEAKVAQSGHAPKLDDIDYVAARDHGLNRMAEYGPQYPTGKKET